MRSKTIEADWTGISAELDGHGCAVIGPLLTREQCVELAAGYDRDGIFRSHVVMARHGFGQGEYRYFSYPLPPVIAEPRQCHRPLAEIANRWNEAMGIEVRYPGMHQAFLDRCHEAGQTKPTPLFLRYGPGDFNCLHQDLYGEHVFPLQVAILLAEPGVDFSGREFVLTEQRPRMQSRRRGGSVRPGARRDLPRAPSPGRGHSGHLSRQHAPWREPTPLGPCHTAGIIFHDFEMTTSATIPVLHKAGKMGKKAGNFGRFSRMLPFRKSQFSACFPP